jgi:DNA-binding response OmpR family regulator
MARQRAADAIVLDLKLTGMSAESFLAAYRGLVCARTPVILVSAASDLAIHAARLGADSVVAKPFDLDALCETVRRCVEGDLVTSGASDGR